MEEEEINMKGFHDGTISANLRTGVELRIRVSVCSINKTSDGIRAVPCDTYGVLYVVGYRGAMHDDDGGSAQP